jgi:hypothetical protein
MQTQKQNILNFITKNLKNFKYYKNMQTQKQNTKFQVWCKRTTFTSNISLRNSRADREALVPVVTGWAAQQTTASSGDMPG